MRARRFVKKAALAAALVASFGAGHPTAMDGPASADRRPSLIWAAGAGQAFVTSPPPAVGTAEFFFLAAQYGNGPARGVFRMVRQRAGFNVDFLGVVTCMTVDPVTHRAWIGGIVVINNSDDPNHTLDIHQPGQDVWFRVVDNGEGAGAPPDRSSVYGFKGAAGIQTSAEYCAVQPWPAGDANAFELTDGNLDVHSR
jgi:hypothetical protein